MQFPTRGRRLAAVASAGLCLAATALASGSAAPPAPGEPAIVSIPAAKGFLNYSFGPGVDLVFGATDVTGPTGLATAGDLLGIECPQSGSDSAMVLVPYREADGTCLDVALAGDWFLLAGRIVALAEDSNEAWAEAFLEATASVGTEGLRDLRVVRLAPPLAPALQAALAALAEQAAGIDMAVVTDVHACADLLARFRPRTVLIEHASADDLEDLAGAPVHSLFLAEPETLDLSVLARLPQLRSLVCLASGSGGTVRLPRQGLALERLVLRCDGLAGIAHLDAQTSLQHLVLMDPPAGALRQTRRLPHLEGLVVGLAGGERVADLQALGEVAGLTMLGLQGRVSQEDFEHLLASNPGIAVLELADCKEIEDLSAVRWLADLRALVCAGTPAPDSEVLESLTQLRLLAVGSDAFSPEKAGQLLGLGERLPECRITPVRGMCLGSGWILLLLPLAGVVVGVRRAVEKRRVATPR